VEGLAGDVPFQCPGAAALEDVSREEEACATVSFQRGLVPNPVAVERSRRDLDSPFTLCWGGRAERVPWRSVAWGDATLLARKAPCSKCRSDRCTSSFADVSVESVKVVWTRAGGSVPLAQWYAAFACEEGRLTRLPHSVVARVLDEAEQTRDCGCGELPHPLRAMLPATGGHAFEKNAVEAFAVQRQHVLDRVCTRLPQEPSPVEVGQCVVCLDEDVRVHRDQCIQTNCRSRVCADCRRRLRGLCPLCDRAKLAPDVRFECLACNRSHPLSEFGYPCDECGSVVLCRGCHASFGLCILCEDAEVAASKRRRACGCGHIF
jgi:hypothetical protein